MNEWLNTEWLDEELNEEQEQEGWVITNDLEAEWAIEKIKCAREEADRRIEHLKRQMDWYNAEIEKADAKADQTRRFFEGKLLEYFSTADEEAIHTTKGGAKKYALPSGILELTAPTVTYDHDDSKLLDWCRNGHKEFIKVKETPNWAEIKKAIVATGEIPDGVEVVEKQSEFIVRI